MVRYNISGAIHFIKSFLN